MDEDAVVARLAQVWRAEASDDPRAQLAEWRKRETDREYRLSIRTPASQRLMVLVCERYGLKPYRLPRQRSSTICVEAPDGFVREILWPTFETMAHLVEDALDEITGRILARWSGQIGGPGPG
jgi:hypothetical protein